MTAFAGHVKMREDYIEHTVDLVKSNRTLVLLLTSYLPWGFLVLGVLLLSLSLCLEARGRAPGRPGSRPRPPTGTGHRLSRAFVYRVGSAAAGSSGHGCFGYRPRSSARTPL